MANISLKAIKPVFKFPAGCFSYIRNNLAFRTVRQADLFSEMMKRFIPATPSSPTSGSSLRMWGTDERRDHAVAKIRFIPTDVGKGLYRPDSRDLRVVHPHACGETEIYSTFKTSSINAACCR